ncbi:hypothetical protein KBC55_00285 [Patescibacteria group bacterium]|nr:hypothetical protein [Patescibacteria group bacterium]
MAHPYQYLLQEYEISIKKLVPLTPPDVIGEAQKLFEDFQRNENVTERQIRQALVHIGKKEYAYRKAYEELCATDEEKRLQSAVIGRLEPAVQVKLQPLFDNGVHVLDYVNSRLFEEQLSSDERYHVEQAILIAHDELKKQCSDRAAERKESYEQLVAKWRAKQNEIQTLIDQLRGMSTRDEKWASEIIGKADQLEEGWSVVERDPDHQEVQKELEYWHTVLEEGESSADTDTGTF